MWFGEEERDEEELAQEGEEEEGFELAEQEAQERDEDFTPPDR